MNETLLRNCRRPSCGRWRTRLVALQIDQFGNVEEDSLVNLKKRLFFFFQSRSNCFISFLFVFFSYFALLRTNKMFLRKFFLARNPNLFFSYHFSLFKVKKLTSGNKSLTIEYYGKLNSHSRCHTHSFKK